METLLKLLINSEPMVEFETESDFGHIQFDGKKWAIFFNAKCVHVSKTFKSALNKLENLGINKSHICFN